MMELFVACFVLLIGSALGEEKVTSSISESHVDVGEEVIVTWTVRQATDMTDIKIVKIVFMTEKDEEGNEIRHQQNILASSVSGKLTKPYEESARYQYEKTPMSSGFDVTLTIKNAQKEDSGIIGLYVIDSEVLSTKLLDVYTTPEMIQFENYTVGETMELAEGERETMVCMAKGGIPAPRFEVTVDTVNYTRFFKHHESRVRLPDCYSSSIEDSCILHYETDSSATAADFRPDISANKKELVCKAHLDGSVHAPTDTSLYVIMTYTPKFRCWQKHKVALHTVNYQLNCSVASSPAVKTDSIQFEVMIDGRNEILKPGDSTENDEIEFLDLRQSPSREETNVTLKFDQIFERHYNLKFILKADNLEGENQTTLQLVEEDFVRGSANIVCHGILALIAGLLSVLML